MANCFHTALEMPPCRNNSEDTTTDARSEGPPESNSEAKDSPKRDMIYAISCVLAVLLDPLFLYIPILNDDMKCIGVDKNMKIVAVALRSFTDLIYIVKIIFQIYELKKTKEIWESCMMLVKCGAMEESGGSQAPPENAEKKCLLMKKIMGPLLLLVVHILAVLPIPQVVIIFFFTKMSGSELNTIIMNSLVVFQYVPRVFCIYLACKEFEIPISLEKWEPWLKGGLSFFMYILASNVFGGLWYFFSIQRMIYCWQSACHTLSDHNDCKPSAFECHSQPTIKSRTLAYNLCPINPQNTTLFDFGIFINVLQPRIAGSTDYPQKLTNCLLWALRNLSSFGSNLQPSINTWENIFATSVSIIGLLLFLYLIGKLQIYMGSETSKEEEQRWNREFEGKRQFKLKVKLGPKIILWLHENDLDPKRFKSDVEKEVVAQALDSKKDDVDVNEILLNLSRDLRVKINNYKDAKEIDTWLRKNHLDPDGPDLHFKSNIVEAVEKKRIQNPEFDLDPNNILSIAPDGIRTEIMDRIYNSMARLKQVGLLQNRTEEEYKEISKILQPLPFKKSKNIIKEEDPLILIFIVDGVVSITKRYCTTLWELKAGEIYGEELLHWPSPKATESVKAKTDGEALILKASDLRNVIPEYKLNISKESTVLPKFEINLLSMLKNVPKLKTIDEKVLKAISEVPVEQKNYDVIGFQIIKENDELDQMFLVTKGKIGVTSSSKPRRQLCKVGALYGEELVHWALDVLDKGKSSPHPLSPGTASTATKVDVLILKASDLEKKMMDLAATESESPSPTDSESED